MCCFGSRGGKYRDYCLLVFDTTLGAERYPSTKLLVLTPQKTTVLIYAVVSNMAWTT
jgi:hypothetical protein